MAETSNVVVMLPGGDLRRPIEPPYGGGDDGGNSVEARIAKLESDVGSIKESMSEVKSDLRELRSDAGSNFKWLLAAGGGMGLLLIGTGVAGYTRLESAILALAP